MDGGHPPSLTLPRQTSWRHYFQAGFPGLACQTPSHLTEDHNLLQIFGIHCVFYFRLSTGQPQPTIHRPTAWLSASTAASRTPCAPAAPTPPGPLSCPGCYWASALSRERTQHLTCPGCIWHTISVAKPIPKHR
jgi:hypothetical protein